jgi:hypothetical protein
MPFVSKLPINTNFSYFIIVPGLSVSFSYLIWHAEDVREFGVAPHLGAGELEGHDNFGS